MSVIALQSQLYRLPLPSNEDEYSYSYLCEWEGLGKGHVKPFSCFACFD